MEKFMAFKFPARRHFGFYDMLWLPLLFGSFQTIAGAVIVRGFVKHRTILPTSYKQEPTVGAMGANENGN